MTVTGMPPEESAEDLYENAPCGYLSVFTDGTIFRVNRTFLTWTGHSRDAVLGRRIQEFYPVGSRVFHETYLVPLLHMQGEVRGAAAEFRRADGSRLDAFINAVLQRTTATGPAGPAVVRMTVFDATDRRAYERELLAERRRAELNASRIRVLQEMVAGFAAVERAEQLVGPIARFGADALGATVTSVWLLDEARSVLRLTGGEDEEVPLDGPAPLARAVASRDVQQHRTPDAVAVVTPMVVEDRLLGVVSFAFDGRGGCTTDEVELVRTVGRQAGQALDRARLHEETTRRAWQAGFLARLSRDLAETVGCAERAQLLADLLVPDVAGHAQIDLDPAAGPECQVATRGTAADTDGMWTIPQDVLAAIHTAARGGPMPPVPLRLPDGRNAVVLALRARDTVLGTLLLSVPPGADLAGDDFLADLVDRAALALDNARLAERDRAVAGTLQRSLLVGDWPTDSRYRVASMYRPAVRTLEVGGDWYDIFATSTGSLGIVVGDVVGRGLHAASVMGQVRSAVRALATAEGGPAKVLRHMDSFVATLRSGQMTTLAYAELDLGSGELRYACAGHPPPLLMAPGRSPAFLWDGRSGPLGATAASRTRGEATVTVPAGSRLVLYTDGLVERHGERISEGLDRLSAFMDGHWDTPLPALTRQLGDAMVPTDGGHDDVCVLAVDFTDAPRLQAEVPASMDELAKLRRRLGAWLAEHHVGEHDRFCIVLAVTEAVANAIEHGYRRDARRQVSVLASIDDDTVHLRVADTGGWTPPRPTVDRSRGMALMGRMMDQMVVDRGAGTTILMRRRVTRMFP